MQTEKRGRGRPKSGLTLQELQAKSDAKRGVKVKGFKLPETIIAKIEQLAKDNDIPQNQLIIQAIELFEREKGA